MPSMLATCSTTTMPTTRTTTTSTWPTRAGATRTTSPPPTTGPTARTEPPENSSDGPLLRRGLFAFDRAQTKRVGWLHEHDHRSPDDLPQRRARHHVPDDPHDRSR